MDDDEKYDDTDSIAKHAGELAALLGMVMDEDGDHASSNAYARNLALATMVAAHIKGQGDPELLEWFIDEVRAQIGLQR